MDLNDYLKSLYRVTTKWELFHSREDDLRDLRRQLSECETNTDQTETETLAETHLDEMRNEDVEIQNEKEFVEKR